MCKFANKTKNMCSKIVGAISLLMGLLAIVTLAFAGMMSGAMPPAVRKIMPDQPNMSGNAIKGVMAFGALILVTSCLGCATARMKKPCFAIPFGAMTFVFGLILLIIGLMTMAVSSGKNINDMMEKTICKNDPKNPAIMFDNKYNEMISKPMCSKVCPCDKRVFTEFKKNLDDATARKFGRTFRYKGSESSDESRNGVTAKYVYLQDNNSGAYRGKDGYVSFEKCWTAVQSVKATKQNHLKEMNDWFKLYGADMLSKLENEFDCAGLCSPQLFYVTRPFDKQPKNACFGQIANKIGPRLRTLSIVSILTALVSFCAFCGSFPLCTGFNEEEDK